MNRKKRISGYRNSLYSIRKNGEGCKGEISSLMEVEKE
jgi:hypothetical protein